ncbi:GRASP55/65 PDZ-like domain-containing protein [Earliella scabrosa]|nr:GRASP55/65 PDZ-like domain-containing protein [Earliella scabrosa]
MGAGQSTASQTIPPRALHVLRVTPSSPASETTIEPYFDFVVGYKGDTLASNNTVDASELERIVESHEGRTLNLLVWNSKSKDTRVVPIVPSRDWSSPHANIPDPQEPEAERKPSLLGLSMRVCEPEFAMDNVWHVLDVLEGSPAESAGLVPYGDWIIGWSGGVLSAEGDFYDVVEAHIEKPLRVYVYSYDFDTIREVVLIPNRHWGGEGLLGCVFGFGLLHRIPPLPADREPGAIPPELAQEVDEDFEEQQLFVPADLPGAAETPEEFEERVQWEQEEWERVQSYGQNYVHDHDPAYQTSSAYPRRAGVQHQHQHPDPTVHGYDAGSTSSESLQEVETPHVHSHQHDHHHHHGHGHDHAHDHNHDHVHEHHNHSHTHGHDSHDHHHHSHGHNHDRQPASPPPAPTPVVAPQPQTPVARPAPPQRSSSGSISLTSPARASTPTPTRPFGVGAAAYMNGLGRSMSPRTPSWVGRPSFSSSGFAAGAAGGRAGAEADDEGDDATDVTDTDTTDATSQGSLTSVD